jgi:hypothetical protein
VTKSTPETDAVARQERRVSRQAQRAKAGERAENATGRIGYDVKEFAHMVGRDPATVARWVKSGAIKSVKIGGARIIAASEVERIRGGE